ncbi:E3 ubiquitin-protein ligase ZNF598 [Denticeps clupeoides]|uniref:E3 ubiquitin-protein ligase ZNF598 n=1 Tax=Denticeps clupeoides TaxID=299321 RepID=UPI0010A4E90E|nr:E3 ubiquitin-protein ligase ZNF598 [Denticeps clupeoides]
MESTSARETERVCVLCCQDIDIFALGKCDHPVCYRCSTKMRVLCEQRYCAVCRVELDKVIFVKTLRPFASIACEQLQCERKHDIYFSDGKIYAQFRRILLPECPRCPEQKVFSKFEELEQHMRKQHELFCCKLCVKHLKIFSHERKWYNRKDLARHRTQGDPDDTSHRGHPLCKFCDDRYLDNDELLKHLRRDHYFCHFCDADGAQEYYSDYQYLREHFRDSHYLCEEGRCSTEQFTHAFRTEIDYKAHKAAAHSKNRAEARQNRQIDLQFTYAPRQQRRYEGLVGGEDFEEFDRLNRRPGRGRAPGTQQNMRKSWRYNREEEDRDVAAALQASLAFRRQEEKGVAQERNISKPREAPDPEETRSGRIAAKPPSDVQGRPVKSNAALSGADFPVLGVAAPVQNPARPTPVALKEDDFPSLSSTVVSTPMMPAYNAQSRKQSSFQEEDFPALVSKIKPHKPQASTASAWSGAGNKPVAQQVKAASAAAAPSAGPSSTSGPQPLSSTSSFSSASSRRKKRAAEKPASKVKSQSSSDDDDVTIGKSTQEIRSVPTMLDISSLLTVKGGPTQPSTKAGKKKKQVACVSSAGPLSAPEEVTFSAAQKENVPEAKPPDASVHKPPAAAKANVAVNGCMDAPAESSGCVMAPTEQPPVVNEPPPPPTEEDFPALTSKKPPPGFKGAFPLKSSQQPGLVPPPPGLGPVGKPPPGFTGVPLNGNVEPTVPLINRSVQPLGTFLAPENFQQRNMDLIQSIKNFLLNDESKFNEFKTYSGQFRQGVISAAQYHRSCQELLGDNFSRVFNELLVLLPDTQKQQELLTAHGDSKALEKQQGTAKAKKNKKKVWQTVSGSLGSELDCQVCPTCRQVLAMKDFNYHKALHIGDDDFPSLQSISKVIS